MTLNELEKNYTKEELNLAISAIHDSDLADKLLQEENKLVDFTMDISLQNLLFEWFDKETKKYEIK